MERAGGREWGGLVGLAGGWACVLASPREGGWGEGMEGGDGRERCRGARDAQRGEMERGRKRERKGACRRQLGRLQLGQLDPAGLEAIPATPSHSSYTTPYQATRRHATPRRQASPSQACKRARIRSSLFYRMKMKSSVSISFSAFCGPKYVTHDFTHR